jgi:CheY-like chemotaxis protein
MVVDDHRDTAESFARVLALFDCQAVYFTDPATALRKAASVKPDIVFLDIGMPRIDGYALARALREQFSSERLWIVAVTAYDSPKDRARSRSAGFDAHVAKPVDPSVVRAMLEELLQR